MPLPHAHRGRARPSGWRAVLHVLYLIFSEGYASSIGPALQRADLANEAIRLARAVHALLPRRRRGGRSARADAAHRCPPRRPHRPARRADPARRAGPRPLEPVADRGRHRAGRRGAFAAAASGPTSSRRPSRRCTTRPRASRTPTGRRSWRSTGCCERMSDNPMVALNHAIAAAMVHGPAVGLGLLRLWTPTTGSAAITGWLPCAAICSRWRASGTGP